MTQGSDAPRWAERLRGAIEGEVLTDVASRGRYATDASIYQCFPAAVALPKSAADLAAVLETAAEEGVGATVRGGGTSTGGQTLTDGIVIDCSKYLSRFLFHDEGSRSCVVEPGITLDEVNRRLRGERLWFPVDAGLGHAATIGGMLGNNASGVRALRYGRMADNVIAVDALLANGAPVTFRDAADSGQHGVEDLPEVILDLLQFGEEKEAELRSLWTKGRLPSSGADLGCLLPSDEPQNLGRLLAGSEGQLAIATRIELRLADRPRRQALGICRFRTLKSALATVPAIVALGASAVELLDAIMLEFGAIDPRARASLEPQLTRALQGEPEAVLIVEFGENNPVENSRRLKALDDLVAPVSGPKLPLVEVMGAKAQAAVWRFRRQAIERAYAVRSAAQGLAFLDDCAVPLPHLAEFGEAMARHFRQAGVRAAIYGHAGAGCLYVRPALDVRAPDARSRMRDMADALLPLLRKYDGRLTGGHGLGIARLPLFRSIEPGAAELMAQVKAILDPRGVLDPGKFTGALRADDPALFRSTSRTAAAEAGTEAGHADDCTGLAFCRKREGPFACPSWAVTRDEKHSPRGRANTVRLALSGKLAGDSGLGHPALLDAMSLCVSCKACRSACPAAVDVPRMKAEVLAASREMRQPSRGEEFYARLPFHLDRARDWRYALRLRDLLPGLPRLSERWLGLAADRAWPAFRGSRFKAPPFDASAAAREKTVALFADCLNEAFEPSALLAASKLLKAGGYSVVGLADGQGHERLCCGRTLYDSGLFEEAKAQARRLLAALEPLAAAGVPVIGLEPACALMLRDEYQRLIPDVAVPEIDLFEAFLLQEHKAGRFRAPFKPVEEQLIIHPHCHQRAHGVSSAAAEMLRLVPGLEVSEAPPGCCGLNGIFGYTPETFEASLAMAELALFPALRKAGRNTLAAATGLSCRKQIRDGLGRPVSHPAVFLLLSLNTYAEAT